MHDENHFVTFTYDKKHEPRGLEPTHFQKFMKRLRKKQPGVRYFMCGEYGDNTQRPHYHAAMFGLHLHDQIPWDQNLKTSKTLTNTWGKGNVLIGELTFESAAYIAAYCTKKITGAKAKDHYERTDIETGEIYDLTPEYARMSLKPAIGRKWIEKYTDDVYNYDHVVIKGRAQKAPRYYDKYLEQTQPEKLEKHKINRQLKAKQTQGENTPNRLKDRETYALAKHKQQHRTL